MTSPGCVLFVSIEQFPFCLSCLLRVRGVIQWIPHNNCKLTKYLVIGPTNYWSVQSPKNTYGIHNTSFCRKNIIVWNTISLQYNLN